MTHQEMLNLLWKNPAILKEALGWSDIFYIGMEYKLGPQTRERADLVVRDSSPCCGIQDDAVVAVIELKSRLADHEVLGQLKKAVTVLEQRGLQTKHWSCVRGVAIAPRYTDSAIQTLMTENYTILTWHTHDRGFSLRQLGA